MGAVNAKDSRPRPAFEEEEDEEEEMSRRNFRDRLVDACLCRRRRHISRVPAVASKLVITKPQLEGFDIITYEQELVDLLHSTNQVVILFIFGGPGSKKGAFVENLLQTFKFHLVSAEQLIKRHLPEKVEECARRDGLVFRTTPRPEMAAPKTMMISGDTPLNENQPTWYSRATSNDSTLKIKLMLQDYPDELTLEWTMSLLANEIKRMVDKGVAYFLVDMLPNLDFMYVHSFNLLDCSREMRWFEAQFTSTSTFALFLKVTDEEIEELFAPATSSLLDGINVKGDAKSEIDIAMVKRRNSLFLKAMRPYFEYFRSSNRLMTIHPARVPFETMWTQLRDSLVDLKMRVHSSPDVVLLFLGAPVSSKTRCKRLIRKRKSPQRLSTVEDLEKEFQNYFSGKFKQRIIVCDMKLYHQLPKPKELKQIIFFEDNEETTSHLSVGDVNDTHHLAMSTTPEHKYFRIVSSPNNVICFFPLKADKDRCRLMASQVLTLIDKMNRQ